MQPYRRHVVQSTYLTIWGVIRVIYEVRRSQNWHNFERQKCQKLPRHLRPLKPAIFCHKVPQQSRKIVLNLHRTALVLKKNQRKREKERRGKWKQKTSGYLKKNHLFSRMTKLIKFFVHNVTNADTNYMPCPVRTNRLISLWDNKRASKASKIIKPRASLGYFYNTPHGGGYFESPLISETTVPNLKIQAAFESPGKNCEGKINLNDLGVTSGVTALVKIEMFDFSGLVTSASKISMLSSNKAT